ncbi:MAG: hypothetical protein EXS15_02220 [Phycisphaerales bacterium]|nr:hypothetical protein [Phycisphaerales bacterium]
MPASAPVILFTAFEPSGDAHAAVVIAALRRLQPSWRIVAWGGARMEAAGAELIARTADDGTMGIPALSKVIAISRIAADIDRFAMANQVAVHVPVDSPAANFPMCKRMKRRGARIVHLVAPQIWAWGPWRIRKLRRLTDHVLCLLPFEEKWFRERGVQATFIGHPVMSEQDQQGDQCVGWKEPIAGSPRVLLLPGSRSIEVDRNGELLMELLRAVSGKFPQTSAVVCAASPNIAQRFRERVGDLGPRTSIMTGVIAPAAAWCDLALAVSGTVSLDITRARKPMIGVYRTGRIAGIGASVMLRTPHRLLPNILAGRRLVPEFVPWSGSSQPIIQEALRLASDASLRADISRALQRVCETFAGHDPGREGAAVIVRIACG